MAQTKSKTKGKKTSVKKTKIKKRKYVTKTQIRKKAYEIYLERNNTEGNEIQDWLLAERILKKRIKKTKTIN